MLKGGVAHTQPAQNEYQKALEDAEKSTQIKPDWSKGHARKGAAYWQWPERISH
jgi:Flp pilus assembly protein TadD